MMETTETGKNGEFLRSPLGKREKSAGRYAGIREWQAELSISRLFRTSIRLQTAFDRCFSQFGMTAQAAAVPLHCAQQGQTSAGKLAEAMGRDKSHNTRFFAPLPTGRFLTPST